MSIAQTTRFVIDDIDIRLGEEPHKFRELRPDENVTDYVEVTDVVTHIQFYPNGEAGLWANIHIGNISETHYVTVDDVVVRLDKSNLDGDDNHPQMAEGGEGYVRENGGPDYIWNEVTAPDGVDNDWRSMFDDFELIENHDLFDAKNYHGENRFEDRLFLFSLDQDNAVDHLICNPVTFTRVRDSDGPDSRLIDFETMMSGASNELLPKSEIAQYCPKCQNDGTDTPSEMTATHKDVVSFWAKWNNVDIMMNQRQVDFEYEFMIESNVGDIRHLYMYYVLPQGARFVRSMSKDEVSIFKPKEVHWMFKAWEQETDIERTGPDNRVLRSRLKNRRDAYNLAEYYLVARDRANRLLEKFSITLIPAFIGTFASALITATIFGGVQNTTLVVSLLIGLLLITIVALVGGIYVNIYDKYTIFSKFILSIAERVNGWYE